MFAWLKTAVDRENQYPPAPEGLFLYAIGDIHGRSDSLTRVHDLIDRDIANRCARDSAIEVYLGDYVDRGPDSKGVIDLLIARSARAPTVLLKGNHEIIMESFLRGTRSFEDWRQLGGLETALSYGVDARTLLANGPIKRIDLAKKIPVTHLRFLSSLRNICQIGRYCFVHAGLRPGVPVDAQLLEDLTWIREDFLDYSGDFGAIVVHGHTPVSNIDFRPNRINIDTGAFATNRLSVIRIDASGVAALDV
jgi:serine/threonine protein phosphatase 1